MFFLYLARKGLYLVNIIRYKVYHRSFSYEAISNALKNVIKNMRMNLWPESKTWMNEQISLIKDNTFMLLLDHLNIKRKKEMLIQWGQYYAFIWVTSQMPGLIMLFL